MALNELKLAIRRASYGAKTLPNEKNEGDEHQSRHHDLQILCELSSLGIGRGSIFGVAERTALDVSNAVFQAAKCENENYSYTTQIAQFPANMRYAR